jgi:endoglucanase
VIRVQGNHLVDLNGATVQLRGVNRPSTEYACIHNDGIHSVPPDDTELAAMQNGWHINAVRVPLNESCWLGHGSINPNFSGVNYQNAIRTWVRQITARGVVAILDMHWSEAGSQLARDQQPMADRASGPAFWRSVANIFKTNPLAVFDLYNEPYPDHENLTADKAWSCWRDGCILPVNVGQNPSPDGATFQAAGMQELINAVRAARATNPVMLGGLDYSGDLTGFLTHLPTDPAKQIVASWHAYPNKPRGLDYPASWDQVVAPVAAAVPVVAGEFGRNDCTTTNVKQFLDWMDVHQLSYLPWAWWVNPQGCHNYDLITDYSTGNPTSQYGKYVQQRYLG